MDCGATCVRMILSYFGKRLSASQIDRLCPKGKTGVSLLSIDDTLKGLGFETIAGCIAVDDILSKASLPCILHWRGEHFVVLYKVSHRGKNFRIHIADPAQGNIVSKWQWQTNIAETHPWLLQSLRGRDHSRRPQPQLFRHYLLAPEVAHSKSRV